MIRAQRGFTLIELLLVIVVAAALGLGVAQFFHTSFRQTQVTTALHDIDEISHASYQWLTANPDFTTLSLRALVDMQLLNAMQYHTDGTQANPWAGDIHVAAVEGQSQQMQITFTRVPNKACQALTLALQNKALLALCQQNNQFIVRFAA